MGLVQNSFSLVCIFEIDGKARERVDRIGGELLLQLRRLLFREEFLPGKVLGAFEWGKGLSRPVPLQVWSPVGSPRYCPRR